MTTEYANEPAFRAERILMTKKEYYLHLEEDPEAIRQLCRDRRLVVKAETSPELRAAQRATWFPEKQKVVE